jgi:hypothetical protein
VVLVAAKMWLVEAVVLAAVTQETEPIPARVFKGLMAAMVQDQTLLAAAVEPVKRGEPIAPAAMARLQQSLEPQLLVAAVAAALVAQTRVVAMGVVVLVAQLVLLAQPTLAAAVAAEGCSSQVALVGPASSSSELGQTNGTFCTHRFRHCP